MAKHRVVPKFNSERAEADWWYENRGKIAAHLEDAAKKGELTRLDKAALGKRLTSRLVTLRIPEEDIDLARRQAAEKGLPYQTYIKSLLHQALRQAR